MTIELPDGGLVSANVFNRIGAASIGPLLVRSTVRSFSDVEGAKAFYAKVPSALSVQGFSQVTAPAVGRESIGFSSPDVLDGQPVTYQTIVFRADTFVIYTTTVSQSTSASMGPTADLARIVLGRTPTGLPGVPSIGETSPQSTPTPQPATAPTAVATEVIASSPEGPPGILASGNLVDAPDLGSNLKLGGFSVW